MGEIGAVTASAIRICSAAMRCPLVVGHRAIHLPFSRVILIGVRHQMQSVSIPASRALALCLALAFAAPLAAQGADVIVGDLNGIRSYGSVGGTAAYAVGTTSCNIGTVPLLWIASTNQHPVIGQNMFRIRNGVFEQVGQSWLKHGFTALQGNLCSPCNANPNGSALGVGCSDPYGASLNGSQGGLGPRFEVNAATGDFPYPYTSPSYSGILDRRLQISHADLDPAQNSGAIYLSEGHYVTPDDAAAGNKNNNASYRRTAFSWNGSTYNASFIGSTVRAKAAIEGWRDFDPTVQIQYIDIPNDGRFIVGRKVLPAAGGFSRYVYAVHNLSSDRSGASVRINVPGGTTMRNATFHDVHYHSGEPFNGTDWTPSLNANNITWQCTETHAQNANANALRWGTCYTFTFEATAAPTGIEIGLFKPEPCPPQPTWPSNNGYALDQSVPFDFVSFSGGTQGPTGDDDERTVNLPFSFPFFDRNLTQIVISSNGYLTLPGENGRVYTNQPIPTGSAPNGIIAGCWDDLNPSRGGVITHTVVGSGANQRFVVDFASVRPFSGSGSFTFQIILDRNGDITTTFVGVPNSGSSATVGLEHPDGASGIQATFNAPNIPSSTSWKFVRQVSTVIPYSADLTVTGNGAPNTNLQVDVLSTPMSAIVVGVDTTNGPTSLWPPSIGQLDLGFSPAFFTLADATGLLPGLGLPPVTDRCGIWSFGANVGPMGLPSGVTLHFQAVVVDNGAPNGVFHISNPASITVP